MFGIPLQIWAAGGGIIVLAAIYEAWRQGGLTALWSYITKRSPPQPISPPADATITDEQAFAAALLLARYKAAGKGSAGYEAAMAAVKAALEVA